MKPADLRKCQLEVLSRADWYAPVPRSLVQPLGTLKMAQVLAQEIGNVFSLADRDGILRDLRSGSPERIISSFFTDS